MNENPRTYVVHPDGHIVRLREREAARKGWPRATAMEVADATLIERERSVREALEALTANVLAPDDDEIIIEDE